MTEIEKELALLSELLQMEKQADLEQYKLQVERLSPEERRAQGFSWYPLQVAKQGYTYGERAFVIVERHASDDEPHQFRPGKIVNLYTRQPAVQQPERSGVIQFVDKNRMKVVLNTRDLPDWLGLGLIGVDLLFDDTSYQEMEKALARAREAKNGRLAELRAVLMGRQPPRFEPVATPLQVPGLNPSQNAAVSQILAALDLAVVHGPPGTGKTTTLVQAVKLITQRENTILVTAPSNTAVDLLTERLSDEGLEVTRIGNISRVDESIISHTLEMKLSNHPEAKNIKKVKIQAAEARRKAQRYKRRFGQEERDERRQLFQEARELSAWALQLENRLISQILDSSHVITATLVGAGLDVLNQCKFRTVVIDEAAQALEPASWIPITRASRVILAGDPFQLPPTVQSKEAQRQGFHITLMEKLLQRIQQTSLLNIQYRMHQAIMGFSNHRFYNNALQADESVREHLLPVAPNRPLVFIDTAGCGFEEKVQEKYLSRYNPEEFLILREHLYQLVEAYQPDALPSIAIISPYREQALHIQKAVADDPLLAPLPLSVNTIDGFQGQERDVVYISLVRSNSKGEIGFLTDYRRMNVAMTRARKKLIVIGDSATIGKDGFYNDFLNYCEEAGAYQTAWEYMRGFG
ncbi:MAG: AAA family ATPase [Phaeodactylibacter sp.]|nr:AAA family ATPase [Phaeodactylibacter sp.]MCB9274626.1 AAA family ATPase [Lewinellaceae bacterium]